MNTPVLLKRDCRGAELTLVCLVLSVRASKTKSVPEAICLKCGMCCNGVIFADIKLQAGDDVRHLTALGLRLKTRGRQQPAKLLQPCAAFERCQCRVYQERPLSCRQFDCLLLQRLKKGAVTHRQALGVIRDARRKVEEVLRLLRTLGDTDEQLGLSARFRQTARRMEESNPDKATTADYGQLTLAMHELHRILSDYFYP